MIIYFRSKILILEETTRTKIII